MVIIPKPSRVNKQGQLPQISINATVEALKIRQNLTLRAQVIIAKGTVTEWKEVKERSIGKMSSHGLLRYSHVRHMSYHMS